MEVIDGEELKISTPARIFCSGPSGCGKTSLIRDILYHADDIFDQPVRNIVFCYGSEQPLYEQLRTQFPKEITFVRGFSSSIADYIYNRKFHDLLIIDDLIHDASKTDFFMKLHTTLSHHWNCSVITVTQNPYFQSKHMRTCNLQATGLILFKTLRGKDQIKRIGQQVFPEKKNFLMNSYNKATDTPFSYLFVDLSVSGNEMLSMRSNILPHQRTIVFRPDTKQILPT